MRADRSFHRSSVTIHLEELIRSQKWSHSGWNWNFPLKLIQGHWIRKSESWSFNLKLRTHLESNNLYHKVWYMWYKKSVVQKCGTNNPTILRYLNQILILAKYYDVKVLDVWILVPVNKIQISKFCILIRNSS